MALAALIVAIVAVLIALLSAAYTRREAIASEVQAVASKESAAIEGKRMHSDLTPVLAVTCSEQEGSNGQKAELTVELTGPNGLDELDEVTIRIRDDIPVRKPGPGSDLTEKQISAILWGPYRLNPGMQDTDSGGRTHGPFKLPKHERYPLQLEWTLVPSWAPRGYWRSHYADHPVRLEVNCRRTGHEPWILRLEAQVKPDPGSQVF